MTDRPAAFETEAQARAAVAHITASPPASWGDGNHRLLEDACRAAGAELGAFDHQVLLWLAGSEPAAVAVVARLIACTPEPAPAAAAGTAMPGGGWISGPSS